MFDTTPATDHLVASLSPAQFTGFARAETARWTRIAQRRNSCGMNTEHAR
ncbi:hypothetical protein [Variovorax sp. Root473]|nr:hypothetical protein [Variovorax sp. Root473]